MNSTVVESMNPNDYPALADSAGGTQMITVAAVFYALSTIAIVLRIWARVLKRQTFAFNDYAALLAFLFCSGLTGVTFASVLWAGEGHHLRDIAPIYRSRPFVIFAAGQPLWAGANTAIKFSILHLYMVIFPGRTFRNICMATMAVSGGYFLSVFLETFLLCKPVAYNWDKTIAGTCSPHSLTAYIVAASTNLVIDVFIVVLPMPALWGLKVTLPKKIGVISMFGLGAVICIISLMRVIKISKADLTDFSYAAIDLSIWSSLEPTLGIVNACLPVLRPVVSRVSESPAFTWAKSSFGGESYSVSRTGKSTGALKTPGVTVSSKSSRGNKFQRLADPTDQLYQLDTIHLVGNEERGDFEEMRKTAAAKV